MLNFQKPISFAFKMHMPYLNCQLPDTIILNKPQIFILLMHIFVKHQIYAVSPRHILSSILAWKQNDNSVYLLNKHCHYPFTLLWCNKSSDMQYYFIMLFEQENVEIFNEIADILSWTIRRAFMTLLDYNVDESMHDLISTWCSLLIYANAQKY